MDNRRKQENHPGGGFFASAETVSVGPVEVQRSGVALLSGRYQKKGSIAFIPTFSTDHF